MGPINITLNLSKTEYSVTLLLLTRGSHYKTYTVSCSTSSWFHGHLLAKFRALGACMQQQLYVLTSHAQLQINV